MAVKSFSEAGKADGYEKMDISDLLRLRAMALNA